CPLPSLQLLGTTASSATPFRRCSITSATVSSPGSHPSPVVALACGSRSTTSVFRPLSKAAPAKPSTVVVLPTPPLFESTVSTSTAPPYRGRHPEVSSATLRTTRARVFVQTSTERRRGNP